MCCATILPTAAAHGADVPPAQWTDREGNPVPVDGQPRWRADRLWSDEPTNFDAWQPLPYRDKALKATASAT